MTRASVKATVFPATRPVPTFGLKSAEPKPSGQ